MPEPLPGDSSVAPVAPPNYDEIINRYSQKYGVNPKIIHSLANVEHGTDTATGKFRTSPKGAMGPMQLMPETAKAYGVDPNTPEGNIEGGVRYYSDLLKRHGNDHEALRHYHGIGNDGFTTDQEYATAILNRAQKQSATNVSQPGVSSPTSGTKYIRVQGVGRFQVPADYTEDQIRQHIQQLKQSKPEIFSGTSKTSALEPSYSVDIHPRPKDDRGIMSRLLTAAGGIALGPLGAPMLASAFSDKNDITDLGSHVRNYVGPNKPGLDTLGGAVLGPIKAAEGAAEIPEHPIRGANKYLSGTTQTAALPLAIANPGFLAESAPYVGASKVGEGLTSLVTDDPDYQELGGNVAALGLKPGLKGIQKGAEKLHDNPHVDRALTYATTLAPIWEMLHGNPKLAAESLGAGLGAKAGLKLGSEMPDLPTPFPKESPVTRSSMKNSQLRSYMGMGQEPSSSPLGSEEKINLGPGETIHPEDDPTIEDEEDYFRNFKSNLPEEGLDIEGDAPRLVEDEDFTEQARRRAPLQLGSSEPSLGPENTFTREQPKPGFGTAEVPIEERMRPGTDIQPGYPDLGSPLIQPSDIGLTEQDVQASKARLGQQEPTLGPEPEWPKAYQNGPKQTSSTGGGGANYSEADLNAFKDKNKDFLNRGLTEEPAPKPIEKTMQKDDIVSKLDSTTEQLFPGKKVEDLTEEEYNQVADKALGHPQLPPLEDIPDGQTEDVNGERIQIPSLKHLEVGGDEMNQVENTEDFDLLVKAMGWKGSEEFTKDTGYTPQQLIGKPWMVAAKNRVFTVEGPEGYRTQDIINRLFHPPDAGPDLDKWNFSLGEALKDTFPNKKWADLTPEQQELVRRNAEPLANKTIEGGVLRTDNLGQEKGIRELDHMMSSTTVDKPTEQQLATLSDTQLRHAAHQADIPVEPGETAKTLIPKLIKAMNGEPIEDKPKPEEPDIADQLQKSLDAIKNKKNAGQK